MNKYLGNISSILAALLSNLLKERYVDWDDKRWFDDSLITNVHFQNDKLSIGGTMIWGIENEHEQWTDPFYFEILLNANERDFIRYSFLFEDLDRSEISYDYFKHNRDHWYYNEKDWKYIITVVNTSLPQA